MKRRVCFLLTALLLIAAVLPASAMTLAGLDSAASNHIWSENLFFPRMEEKTGLHFDVQQYTDSAEWSRVKAAMKPGAELPDVLFKADLTPAETIALRANGTLVDLTPYLDEYAPNLTALLTAHPDWRAAITLPDGSIGALPFINDLHNQNALWINRSWLDQLGLEAPETADELTEVLRAFRDRDPNQNGKKDEIPLTFMGMWDLKFLSHAFGFIMDDYGLYLDESQTVRTPLTDSRNREFLTWLHQLWEERLLSHDGFSTSDSFRAITDARTTITFGVMLAPTPLSLVPSTALADYEVLLPLKSSDGSRIYRDAIGGLTRGTFAVTSACEHPEEAVAWADRLYAEEGMMLAFAGAEGEEYQRLSDGSWTWITSEEEMYSGLHDAVTMVDGKAMPGWLSAKLQTSYDSSSATRVVTSLEKFAAYTVSPMPLLTLSDEQQQALDALQAVLGPDLEHAMTWFVTGDVPMTDETWDAFCQKAEADGIQSLIQLVQSIIQ